ncbi:MAG: aminotransferase class I/II-fold pyridoxal phosphate-dependent enzyme [bacterium]|nr:aminotransferase class I/II-fold pyridoxal phosphate-dependent enzyme [bacterium]
MKIEPFSLERYFAKHEFSARYLLSCSDCEALTLAELLEMADEEAAALWQNLKLAYTESSGHPLLREAISGIYDGIRPDDTLVVVPEEGIFLLMNALLSPGDRIVCTYPAYQSLYEIARSLGCEVTTWEPNEENGWHFDPEQLGRLLKKPTKLVVVNFPHNPTGFVPTKDEYLEMVRLVEKSGAYLLSDEMYRLLELEPNTTLPAGCEVYERAMSLFGLSKSFGLPGLRLGWVASHDAEVLEQMASLKDYTTICGSAPSEILALIAVRNRKKIVAAQISRARRNLKHLEQFIGNHEDYFSLNWPRGGSICLARLLAAQDSMSFCEDLVEQAGIMLVPSRMFHFGDSHVRFGFGRESFPTVLDHFAEYLSRI